MSSFKETTIPKGFEQAEKIKGSDLLTLKESDIPRGIPDKEIENEPGSDLSEVLNLVFKNYGLTTETTGEKKLETSKLAESKDYSECPEQGEDGNFYDKETGRAYDSIEAWEKAQETLAKRYESTVQYYESKAKKEWARFKNAEQNGEPNAEKWEHYRRSQEYYAKAKECKEKAAHIREKLGQNNVISNDMASFNDQNVVSGIGHSDVVEAFDKLPKERREVINNSFKDAPDKIKDLVERLSEHLFVEMIKESDKVSVSNYNFMDKTIRMEQNLDDDEYAEVFTHEYGHFVDDMLGRPSGTTEFRDAMKKDLAQYDSNTNKGMENFERMMVDLVNSDAVYDRMVSDVLSAFFNNDPAIIQRYEAEGFPCFGHTNKYWARPGTREAEVFANSFSVLVQDNSDSCAFLKNYFSSTWGQLMNILEGGV